jgi:hypothetical protein
MPNQLKTVPSRQALPDGFVERPTSHELCAGDHLDTSAQGGRLQARLCRAWSFEITVSDGRFQ